jgi:hypothetical protein
MDHIYIPDDWHESKGEQLTEAIETRWRDFAQRIESKSSGYLLVDVTPDRVDTLQLICTTANYIADYLDVEPLYLGDPTPTKAALCQSYYPGEFVSANRADYSTTTKVRGLMDFLYNYALLDGIDDLLDLDIGDVPVGDLIYSSSLLNTGEGTFTKINPYLRRRLVGAHLLARHSQSLFNSYDIEAVLGRHIFYERYGVVYRVGMADGAPLYNLKRGTQILGKYVSLSEAKVDFPRPSRALFDCVYEDHYDQAVSAGAEIMTNRIGLTPPAIEGAPDSMEESSSSLLAEVSLPSDSPTVLILPHIFVENLRFDRGLFRDYLTWFRESVRHAATNDDINWLIKPHPNRDQFDQNQSVFQEVDRIIGDNETTVRLVPDSADHADLTRVVDAVLTIDGTAGIEYACYGVPPILAGRSSYSGFGFTHEPEYTEAYFRQLDEVGSLPRLSREQQERALVMAYIQFELIRDNLPSYPESGSGYENALAFVDRGPPEETPYYTAIRDYLREESRHLTRSAEVDC